MKMPSHKRRGEAVRIMKNKVFNGQSKKIELYPIEFYKELVEKCKKQIDVANKIKEVVDSLSGLSVAPNSDSSVDLIKEQADTIVNCSNMIDYYLCEVCGDKTTETEGNVAAIALKANGLLISETIKAAQFDFADGKICVPLWAPYDSIKDYVGNKAVKIHEGHFQTDLK